MARQACDRSNPALEEEAMTFAEAWVYGSTLPGWFSDAEAKLLWLAAATSPACLPFLEIGSYQGRSASLLLRHRTTVLIDSSFLWSNPGKEFRHEEFTTDLEVQGKLCANLAGLPYILVPVPSQLARIGIPKFAFMHIDGDHNNGGVDKDCKKYLPLLASGGLVAFHDYEKGNFPDVVEAVDKHTEGWQEFGRMDSLIVKVKP